MCLHFPSHSKDHALHRPWALRIVVGSGWGPYPVVFKSSLLCSHLSSCCSSVACPPPARIAPPPCHLAHPPHCHLGRPPPCHLVSLLFLVISSPSSSLSSHLPPPPCYLARPPPCHLTCSPCHLVCPPPAHLTTPLPPPAHHFPPPFSCCLPPYTQALSIASIPLSLRRWNSGA